MQDLGTFGGLFSSALGINNSGQVVGWAETSNDQRAFLYSAGSMQDLGTLGGSFSIAFAINNGGQVVGNAATSGNATSHAFLYSGGSLQDLGTASSPYDYGSQATAINNIGQIVGCAIPTPMLKKPSYTAVE